MIAVGLALILIVVCARDDVRPKPYGESRQPFYDGVLGSAVYRPSPEQTIRLVEAALRRSLRMERHALATGGSGQSEPSQGGARLSDEEVRYVIQRSGNGESVSEPLTEAQVEDIVRREKKIVAELIDLRKRSTGRTGREYQGGSHV